ncbi:uncharacterized protein LOC135831139 [Planococcus citri]|uniref:uncharacterized protein LOC135831139 n=1 Tax=Planococcus citri TaxID=170843 RepID=UPI0031F92408
MTRANMLASKMKTQTKPCLRTMVCLLGFMSSMLYLYYYNDVQGYTIVDSSSFFAKNFNDSEISIEHVKHGYVVWSKSCRIPNVDPYHESIQKFVKAWKPLVCSKQKPLTKVIYDATSRTHTIKVDQKALHDYWVPIRDVQCCYWVLSRDEIRSRHNDSDDDRVSISKSICYGQETVLPPQAEYIYVECTSRNKRKKLSYKNIHSMVIEKQTSPPKQATDPIKYSVLFFGIDSISRLNLIRTMPKTVQYLKEKQWLQLEGYNKIGDNTFPNLVAALSGMNVTQFRSSCVKSKKDMFDNCPLIWKNFKNNSYITAYIEDCPSIGTFNFEKYGFMNSPTDYYSRPYLMGAQKFLKVRYDGGMQYCLGMYPMVEYLFEYVTEFTKRFHQQPYFNIFWTNSFSHNELNMPTVMDHRVVDFLQSIENYLNSTIVIFLSDHGMRFGKIRETFVGWLEERMPFLYFWIPPSFKSTYPEKYANFVANKNRLSSPYDLHATLQDILYGQVSSKPAGCPSCDTLFKKIPWNRSCENASITEHWCTCYDDFEQVSVKEPVVQWAAVAAVNRVNQFFSESRNATTKGKRCASLSLHKILSVHSKFSVLFNSNTYLIVFAVKPSGAIFEATVQYKTDFKVSNSISRINEYGNQSSCVHSDSNLKKYCFCV